MRRFILSTVVAVLAIAADAAPAAAQQPQDIYSPVILFSALYLPDAGPRQMHEDGTGQAPISLGGDLTHNGVKGQRWLLRTERPANTFDFPDGFSKYQDLVVYDESATTRTVLTSDRTISRRGLFVWSVDGTRIAYTGERWDMATGAMLEQGVYVAEVVFGAGNAPVAITDERLVYGAPLADEFLTMGVSWASDNLRIAYVSMSRTGAPAEVRVIKAPRPATGEAPSVRPVVFVAAGNDPFEAKFSPVPGDDRLGIVLRTGYSGPYNRNDIFHVTVPADYDGATPLPATPMTTNHKLGALGDFEWSPDGTWVAFRAVHAKYNQYNLYKCRVDGSASLVQLTGSKKQSYGLWCWRK